MKPWQKFALGFAIGTVLTSKLTEEKPKERCTRVRNKEMWFPPNNGGL